MDEPITDVVFVTDEKDTPKGYKVLTQCPDQHSANLWQKFLGAKTEIRYICYTKEDKDGTVVEDMYIPGSNERYIMKGYTVVKRTVTGEDSLNLKYLAVKKSPRRKAKKAVMDLAVFRSKDKPAAIYKKLGAKLNGLYICIRLDDLKDKATTSGSNTAVATSSTSPPAPSSSSPHQTAPSSKSSQPSPLPPSPPQPSPPPSTPPSTSPVSSAPPHAEPPSSSPPPDPPALESVTPPPVAAVPDSSTYPAVFAVTQASPPPTSTYDPAQFASSSGPSHTNPSAVPGPSSAASAPVQAPPYDVASFGSAPVGSGNSDHGAVTASEVHTVALGFELLDLDQPIPESFQQLADSPPDSDDEFSPSEFYQDGTTQVGTGGYSQELQVTRSRTIGHGSGPVTASGIQKRSGSMYTSSSHPPASQGYPPPQLGTQGYPPQPGSQGYPPNPGNLGYSTRPGSQGYPPQPGSQGYPPQPGSQGYPPQPGSQGYPAQPAGLGYPPLGYPPRPGNQGYPPPAGGQGYPPQGYPPPAGGSGYPPQPSYTNVARPLGGGYPAPVGFAGYNAGPAFGAAPVNPASSGPRPFNPYAQGHQAYPPTNTSYGFKI